MLQVFNEALTKGSLPPSFYEASMSLIHKNDPLEPGVYRLISLNVLGKILAKIRATCLENVLPTIVSRDQTGFYKRYIYFLT